MTRSLTAQELFDDVSARLELNWVGKSVGADRKIEIAEGKQRRPSLVGYLNLIHPNKIQILGAEELAFLDALGVTARRTNVQRMMKLQPAALVFARGLEPPDDVLRSARRSRIPIWRTGKRGHDVLTYLQYHLARSLAPQTTLHGVFLEVYSIGVLITGDAGAGKSELALELITRGHRLVADDAPEFTLVAPDVIDGTCPEILRDCLEVRGLGVLNVREMFGDTAVKRNKYLRLIVHLGPTVDDGEHDAMKRLYGDVSSIKVFEVDVPRLVLPVAAGRNLAVLVEAAVRNHVLKSKGIDAAQTFVDRQAHTMKRQRTW
ncbi:MAG: HPr(Ser) kinase/phosphatase [Lysobacterales bacterium]|nr:HPr(Ser) kinase/phosphatase [Xanthomonadales bacterium]MCB1612776.1 HPr(Ser) kinase/phosphatase [Xanthomonadales bacterium]MCP5474703.1 HPr(Ser) kinase/phosphatase [Rhodanobacteraceae bacterium]